MRLDPAEHPGLEVNPLTLGAGPALVTHAFAPTHRELAGHEVMDGSVVLPIYQRASARPRGQGGEQG